MRFRFPSLSRRSLLISAGVVLALGVAAALVLFVLGHSPGHLSSSGDHPGKRHHAKTVIADRGIDPKAASWTKPWHPGNPQAKSFGEAYQTLDPQHPPANAGAVFWLGGVQGALYPYARAMQGGHREIIQSSVTYGDKRSADLAHLLITTWDTRPFPVINQQTQGGKLLDQFRRLPHHTAANGLVWADTDTPSAGWQALVDVGPNTIVQVIRMDGTVPPLPALVAKLQPFKAAPPPPPVSTTKSKRAATRPAHTRKQHKHRLRARHARARRAR